MTASSRSGDLPKTTKFLQLSRPTMARRPNNFSLSSGAFSSPQPPRRGMNFQKVPCGVPASSSFPPNDYEQQELWLDIVFAAGTLTIDGREYQGVNPETDLESLGNIGQGACGCVVKMTLKKTDHVFAVKQMRLTSRHDSDKRVQKDLEIVRKCRSDHIVTCYGFFVTQQEVWICMELMATCFDKLLRETPFSRGLPEPVLGKLVFATVEALDYLKKEHNVIHRDIKPPNILLSAAGQVRLCDFSIAGQLVDSQAKTKSAGCPRYMSPERLNSMSQKYDIRADVWSLGITLIELATGRNPYSDSKSDFEILSTIAQEAPPSLPTEHRYSDDFAEFVGSCLIHDYQSRPKYETLRKSPYFERYRDTPVDVNTILNDARSRYGPPLPPRPSGFSANPFS